MPLVGKREGARERERKLCFSLFSFVFFSLQTKKLARERLLTPLSFFLNTKKAPSPLSLSLKRPARAPSALFRASPRAGSAAPRAPAAIRGRLAARGLRREEGRGSLLRVPGPAPDLEQRRAALWSLSLWPRERPLCTARRGPSGARPPESSRSSKSWCCIPREKEQEKECE